MDNKYIKEMEFSTARIEQNVEWKELVEKNGYFISDKPMRIGGKQVEVLFYEKENSRYRVVSVRGARKGTDYLCFDIYGVDNKKGSKALALHRARLAAFQGDPPEGKPHCCHADGNAKNNDLSNLRWGSHDENMDDVAKHGSRKGGKNPSAKIDEKVALALYILTHLNLVDSRIYSALHISKAQISKIKIGGAWSHMVTENVRKLVEMSCDSLEQEISKRVSAELDVMQKRHANELKKARVEFKKKIGALMASL